MPFSQWKVLLTAFLILISIANSTSNQLSRPRSSKIRFPGPSGYSPKYERLLMIEQQQQKVPMGQMNYHKPSYNVMQSSYPIRENTKPTKLWSRPAAAAAPMHDFQQWMADSHYYNQQGAQEIAHYRPFVTAVLNEKPEIAYLTPPESIQQHHPSSQDEYDHAGLNVNSILFYPSKPIAAQVNLGSEPYKPRPL